MDWSTSGPSAKAGRCSSAGGSGRPRWVTGTSRTPASEDGAGSTVRKRSPRVTSAEPRVSPPRILALDDDPLFLRILGDRLTQAGMTFLGIREPARAVPSAASFNPDLLLLDRHMPVLTGTEVIRSLRAF